VAAALRAEPESVLADLQVLRALRELRRELVERQIAQAAGRRLDDASPFLDAPLPGGVRPHAVLPPIAPDCTCVSLRVLRPATQRLDALGSGTVVAGSSHTPRHRT
jgi:Flp pilus assembly CpaF family ATPase